jgi:hypothetical protein
MYLLFFDYVLNIFGIVSNINCKKIKTMCVLMDDSYTKAEGLADRAKYGGFGLWPPYRR